MDMSKNEGTILDDMTFSCRLEGKERGSSGLEEGMLICMRWMYRLAQSM